MVLLISFFVSVFILVFLLTDAFSRSLKKYHTINGGFKEYITVFFVWFFFFCGVWKIIEMLILASQIVWWFFTGSVN